MKKIITVLSVLMLFSVPSLVLAQKGQSDKEIRQQDNVQNLQVNQVQIQNQVQTQNQGENSQLQVSTQEQEELQEGQNEEGEGQAKRQLKQVNLRSETAREQMSIVAEKVEELLTTQEAKGGIGSQVRQIAQEQKQAQTEIEGEVTKLNARSGFIKRLFGPDRKAIRNLNRQIERNRLRIQRIEQLAGQAQNQAEETQLQEVVQVLAAQNTALEEQIQAEDRIGSLFGWLVKLFNR